MSIEERVRRGLTKEESAHQAAIPLASWWAEFVGGKMTYEEAVKTILPGRYRHFKGNEYEVIGIARHSEDESPVVVYRALYGDSGLWVRPAEMWNETVTRDRVTYQSPEWARTTNLLLFGGAYDGN